MAITIEAAYSKKLGLPGYSSHSFSVMIRTEITDMEQLPETNDRLYALLQESVDQQIRETGFVPEGGSSPATANGNGNGNGYDQRSDRYARSNGYGRGQGNGSGGRRSSEDDWLCSPKQRGFILQLMEEHGLEFAGIEEQSRRLFDGKALRELNRMEASGLIDELLREYGNGNGNGNGNRRNRGQRQTTGRRS